MKMTADDKLVEAARAASKRAYAPYSNFRVGAAVALDDGTFVTGCNVENASFGLTICAERSALFAAVAAGATSVTRIAVAVDVPAGTAAAVVPCGACLQVLAEFMPADGEILIDRNRKFLLKDLLPHSFKLSGTKLT